MGDVIVLPMIRSERDGGKARILRRRAKLNSVSLNGVYPNFSHRNDLSMDHADPEVPYVAPDHDCA